MKMLEDLSTLEPITFMRIEKIFLVKSEKKQSNFYFFHSSA
jgi:hypothetical protein